MGRELISKLELKKDEGNLSISDDIDITLKIGFLNKAVESLENIPQYILQKEFNKKIENRVVETMLDIQRTERRILDRVHDDARRLEDLRYDVKIFGRIHEDMESAMRNVDIDCDNKIYRD